MSVVVDQIGRSLLRQGSLVITIKLTKDISNSSVTVLIYLFTEVIFKNIKYEIKFKTVQTNLNNVLIKIKIIAFFRVTFLFACCNSRELIFIFLCIQFY